MRVLSPAVGAPRRLHLRPLSLTNQRLWRIGDAGSDARPAAETRLGSELWLATLPDNHESFASLLSVIRQLQSLDADADESFDRIRSYLHETGVGQGAQADGHGRLMTDAVAFAIMRRISRESVYTARLIDLAARTLNSSLRSLPDCSTIHVPQVDRLDRPSLKVLARAMLLLQPSDGFGFVWHSESDPSELDEEGADLYRASRAGLLRQLLDVVSPTLESSGGAKELWQPAVGSGKRSMRDVGAALTVQNYDACFLWCRASVRSELDTETPDGMRLLALAAINVGAHEEAMTLLDKAEELAVNSGLKAHLCYLQGLVEAKRTYDLSKSAAHYKRGIDWLSTTSSDASTDDLELEQAWLLNGIALNEAVLWRRSQLGRHYKRAFELVHTAFALVGRGSSPSRTYLRFNLIANSALLLEMRGNFDLAIDVLKKAFDLDALASETQSRSVRTTLCYRIGVLHSRAGRLDQGRGLLYEALELESQVEDWPNLERILRALGALALDGGKPAEAVRLYERGLEICREARSAEGTREHGRGLCTALLAQGKERAASAVIESLLEEEEVEIAVPADASDSAQLPLPTPVASKLPPYIPEIDLEEVPGVDINRFLSGTLPRDSEQRGPWR